MSDIHELDQAFTLPEVIEEADLRELYEVLVARMRKEAEHLPMNTVQQLLIERIAYNYIVLRWYEMRQMFAHSTAQKEFNSFWLSMTQEFNKQLRGHDEDVQKALMKKISDIFSATISSEDDETAVRIRARFVTALGEAGF